MEREHGLSRIYLEITQAGSKQKLGFQFADRTCGNAEEADEVSRCWALVAFGDVVGNGPCCFTSFSRQTIPFVTGILLGQMINLHGKLHGFLPDHKVLEGPDTSSRQHGIPPFALCPFSPLPLRP